MRNRYRNYYTLVALAVIYCFITLSSCGKQTTVGGRSGMTEASAITTHEGFKIRENTYVNVLHSPDNKYYVELKKKFKTQWNPSRALKHEKRKLANRSSNKISTVVGLGINSKGELIESFIIKSSDIPGFDAEVVRAVREASPFTRLPQKLRGKDNILRIAWTFIVYL